MAKRDWLISPLWLGAISLAVVAYAIAAVRFGGIITDWPQDEVNIQGLLLEVLLLWMVLCLGVGFLAVVRKQPCTPNARYWPIVVIPLALGLSSGVPFFVWAMGEWMRANVPMSFTLFVIMIALSVCLIIVPAGLMWFQARVWKRLRQTGYCFDCGYELTGNTSGRCPECGRLTDAGSSKRFMMSTRWLPELNLFVTAAQRDKAWCSVQKEIRKKPLSWLILLVGLAAITCCSERVRGHLGQWWWPVIGILAVMAFASVWGLCRLRRRLLRRKLIEAGIPVCLDCGRDLRDETATACRSCRGRLETQGQTKRPD